MRTLQVIASRALGGAEGFFQRLCVGLGERGCQVHAVVRQGAALSPALPAAIPRSELPLRTVWDPLSRRELRHEILRQRPHLVQTWMGRATRLARVPRGMIHVARLGGFYKPGGFDHADALVVNSRGLADHLLAAGLPAKRVHLIGNFVDTPRARSASELAALRASLPLPADSWLLLAVGRCVPVKGWDVLLAALAQLPAQVNGRPLALLLLGDGPLRAALQRRAQQLGLGGRVHFAGWQEDPAPYYALADLVVFPSRVTEALGNVILETWAHGRALVTTASSGARELVQPGQDALQVPCEDAAALAAALVQLLRDEVLRDMLAWTGRARAQRDFDRASVVGAYVDLYRQLLGA